MNHVQTVSAFIQQPYEDSIRLVRRLLVRRGLRLVSEIDVAERLGRTRHTLEVRIDAGRSR
jgi:hypothetical protein